MFTKKTNVFTMTDSVYQKCHKLKPVSVMPLGNYWTITFIDASNKEFVVCEASRKEAENYFNYFKSRWNRLKGNAKAQEVLA